MQAVRGLLALEPTTARLAGGETVVDAADLRAGQEVEVRPGERFPCDGTVLSGLSEADESLLTGESRPREVGPGGAVHGGALNGWGVVRVKAERVGAETAVARIVRAVEHALASRAPVERLADRVTAVFVPTVLLLAAATAAAWWLAGGDPARAVMTGVAVVVIACPCALGLATPAALVVALGGAARRGIFFRDAAALERAAAVRRVAFDKTGTLTDGSFTVREVWPAAGWTEDEVLRLSASAEGPSEHAFGRSLVAAARSRGLQTAAPEAFRAVRGGGVEATVEGRHVLVGSPVFLAARGVTSAEAASRVVSADGARGVASAHGARGVASAEGARGKASANGARSMSTGEREPDDTVAYVAVDGILAGTLLMGDTTRPEARGVVARLAALGVESAVVSGDAAAPVGRAAADAGVPAVRAHHGLSPEAKAELLVSWRAAGVETAMVGDGLNDAPALTAAGVGIALGTGTDVALEAADVALSGSDLRGVPEAFLIARRARRVVRQNLLWALGYNLAAVPLAMAGLVHPALAAGAMALSSVSVLLNATRAGVPA